MGLVQNTVDIHGDVNGIVTDAQIDNEVKESHHRAQRAGLEGRPNQFCDSSIRLFTPYGLSG